MKRLPLNLLCLACGVGGFAINATFGNNAVVWAATTLAPRVIALLPAGLLLARVGAWTGYALTRQSVHALWKQSSVVLLDVRVSIRPFAF